MLAKGLNDGGRGLNIVIISPKTKDVVRIGHFDTYAEGENNGAEKKKRKWCQKATKTGMKRHKTKPASKYRGNKGIIGRLPHSLFVSKSGAIQQSIVENGKMGMAAKDKKEIKPCQKS